MPAKDRNKRYKLKGKSGCPFQHEKGMEPQKIRCKGFEENSVLYINWGDRKKKDAWQKKYCQNLGKGCPLARIKSLLEAPEEDVQNAIKILEALPKEYPDDFIENAVELCLMLLKGAGE